MADIEKDKKKGFFRDESHGVAGAASRWPTPSENLSEPLAPGAVPARGEVVEPGSDGAKALHSVRVTEARQLFDTLERASQDRVRSATRVEELLDQGRAGRYSSQGIESVVEEIVARGSAPAMKAIAGLKGSDQTYAHCSDMSVILMESYCEMLMRQGKEASDQTRRFVLMAGFLHDIGKSEVPKEILDSTVRFAPDSREMQIMRNHATYGARILTEMGMHPATINVAHYHHVKRDTALFASYPAVPYDQVLPLTRLAAIVDVYQALIGKRRYKKNWVSGKAIEYLRALRATEFDEAILDNYVASIGVYPVGTLVRLNTKELAFVVSAGPHGNAARPLVVPVEDASGERLTHHRLTDLMLELDLQVEEVVDHYEHYNQSDDQAYEVFQSIRIAA